MSDYIHPRDLDEGPSYWQREESERNRLAELEQQAGEDADTIIKLTKKYVGLEQQLAELREAILDSAHGHTESCKEMNFAGSCVCGYKVLAALLQESSDE